MAAPPATGLRREVERIRWFHTIDLGHGVVTPGQDESARKLEWIRLPDSLAGKTVLDVGAWDGFFSFEAERRGAERVVAVDPECWREPAWGPNGWGTQQGFNLARRALQSRVEDVGVDLLALGPERLGAFDVVLFLGVFYHLPDPWPYLERVASVTGERLILETHADLIDLRRPAMAHYVGADVPGARRNWQGPDPADPSNRWGPNPALLRALLLRLGFSRIEVVHQDRLGYRLLRAAYRRVKGPRFRVMQGRVALHALR